MHQGAVKRTGPCRPRCILTAIVGDKGYSFPSVRRFLVAINVRLTIPAHNQRRRGPFDQEQRRLRNIRRAPDQSLEALPRLADALRRACRELPSHVAHRCHIEWLTL